MCYLFVDFSSWKNQQTNQGKGKSKHKHKQHILENCSEEMKLLWNDGGGWVNGQGKA